MAAILLRSSVLCCAVLRSFALKVEKLRTPSKAFEGRKRVDRYDRLFRSTFQLLTFRKVKSEQFERFGNSKLEWKRRGLLLLEQAEREKRKRETKREEQNQSSLQHVGPSKVCASNIARQGKSPSSLEDDTSASPDSIPGL